MLPQVFSPPCSPAPPQQRTADDQGAMELYDDADAGQKNIPRELTSHGTTPLGKPRLFVCNTCTRAFARLEHLRRHERLHTKEKPFACGVCQRKFSRRDLLLRHAQKLHLGCADAITRLRRKLIKGFEKAPPPRRGSVEAVQFNLNLFSESPARGSPARGRQGLKDLQRQLFRRPLRRGNLFLAQLGENYAHATTAPGPDRVEFSTPQLAPVDEPWLSNLSTIPGLASRQSSVLLLWDLEPHHDGYSFYEVPDLGPKLPLSPIKQEEEDPMDLDNGAFGANFDLALLDIDELPDFDSKFMPSGYSFYGDNPLVSAESTLPEEDFSREFLFTRNMRHLISRALAKYPISGIQSPQVPPNDKLELYLQRFVSHFLAHFPFIHPSRLNEQEVMQLTQDEDPANESARVCLPLLVATIGALLAGNKNDLEHLYEALRRTVHIYLENRTAGAANPLWLIQSLTLLVIYGLFSDNESNVYIVIRQLNALNSLVKTLVKSGRLELFAAGPVEGEGLAGRFAQNISAQAQRRIVLVIYKLTNFIFLMYNVPLTLGVHDLGALAVPSIYDEYVWGSAGYADFAARAPQSLDWYLEQPPPPPFAQLLARVAENQFDAALVAQLLKVGQYGFSALVLGVFEMRQYERPVDVFAVMDNLTLFIDNAQGDPATRGAGGGEQKHDYALVAKFAKVCAAVDFRLLKEQSWLKNYDELTRSYSLLLGNMDQLPPQEYIRVVDCCIVILKLILFRTSDAGGAVPCGREIFEAELLYLAKLGLLPLVSQPSLHPLANTCAGFERIFNWTVTDEVAVADNLIHLQMLFHVFALLLLFALGVARRTHEAPHTKQLSQRFVLVLRLLAKVEAFLKATYQHLKEQELAGLFLLLSNTELLLDQNVDVLNEQAMADYFARTLDKALYVLKLGELVLRYMYDCNMKLCIFRKLSSNLSQMRKFLIDNEALVLQ